MKSIMKFMSKKSKHIHIIGAFLLALLGFASCSKPEEDPVNSKWDTPMTLYGTFPVSFQTDLPNSSDVQEVD